MKARRVVTPLVLMQWLEDSCAGVATVRRHGRLVLAIAFGANVLFNRSFGSAPSVEPATRESAVSAPGAGSSSTQAGTQSNR
jgi:hypothetical protein